MDLAKVVQPYGLKLKLLSIGASAFIFPLVGVQHLETLRSANNEQIIATQERELEMQQTIETLNQQVSSTNQQLSLKDSQLQAVTEQTGIKFDPGNPKQIITPPKTTHAKARAS